MSANYGLGGIIGIRGLGGERLAAASYALRQNFQKVLFYANGEESRVFIVWIPHTSCQICFKQTPGPPTPHITGRSVRTVTLVWIGASNERASFRVRGVIVGCVDQWQTWKMVDILASERGRDFLSSVLYRPAPNVILSDAWSGHATYRGPRCEHCDTGVDRRP